MLCRVKIPTVLYPNEHELLPQARLSVAFGDEGTFALLPAPARAAAEWLELADLLYNRQAAGELAAALRRAIETLQDQPPRLVPERYIGLVHALDSRDAPMFLEVSVESAVVEPTSPRIVLRSGESLEVLTDTWWLLDGEAQRLGELLRTRAAGELTEAGPNQRAFLQVRPSPERVELRFDDDLLSERGADGIVRLTPAAADTLADLLAQSVTLSAEQPPYVFVPPEPRDVLIAEISW